MLLDLWAHSADVLHYYIDRAASEAFLSTAQQRESVLALANLLDYRPRGRTSAVATLQLQNTTTGYIDVPQYTEFLARNDNKSFRAYATTGACIGPTSTVGIEVAEGTRYTEEILTSSSDGSNGQRYTLSRTLVAPTSVRTYVYEDGVTPTEYQYVTRITAAASGDRVFTTYVAADGSIQVVLGTSLNGFVPPAGSKITASYVVSSGVEGNLPANSVISYAGTTPTGMVIVSTSAFTGGSDEESIASMKLSIPSAIKAQNRAVTRDDFISLALQVPDVAKASLAFVPGSGTGASATNASVTIYPQQVRSDYLTTVATSQAVSASMQTAVVSTLQPLALLGVTVRCATTITWQPIDIIVTVNVSDRYVQSWVQREVQSAIDELFDFDNVFFGQRLHLGQLYRIILNVPGVDYCTVTRFDLGGSTGLQNTILIDPLKLPKKGTVTTSMVGGITTS